MSNKAFLELKCINAGFAWSLFWTLKIKISDTTKIGLFQLNLTLLIGVKEWRWLTTLPFGIVVNCQDTLRKITANQDTDFWLDKPSNQVSCVLTFFTVKTDQNHEFLTKKDVSWNLLNPIESRGILNADLGENSSHRSEKVLLPGRFSTLEEWDSKKYANLTELMTDFVVRTKFA